MDSRSGSVSGSVLVDFLRYVEDLGLRTYDELVIQNASDISRESDRVRVQKNRVYIQEKRRQEPTNWSQRDRLGFMTMPFPQERVPSLGFSIRSQSLHSVQEPSNENHWDQYESTNQSHWDQYEPANQSLRKQPPPKPRRDPMTKLSSETETSSEGLVSEKQPPPKPQRNPSTQLSSCPEPNEDEAVYIEMGPNQNQGLDQDLDPDQDPDLDPDQGEGVYEEMSFAPDSSGVPKAVPAPFPNLLSHRPPLLVLPQNQAKTQSLDRSQIQKLDRTSPPSSDESPLTPLEAALGDFLHQDLKPKTKKNPGIRPEPRHRRTSDPIQTQDQNRTQPPNPYPNPGPKLSHKPDWSHSVDHIIPERGKDRNKEMKHRKDFRERRLDSEPDLRPDYHHRKYHSLRRDRRPDWSQTLDSVKPGSPKGYDNRNKMDKKDKKDLIDLKQRRERSLESLERVLDRDLDLNPDSFTVTSSGRASAPPLRSGHSPVSHSYRRSQSACPSPVKRPPPYDVIMMSSGSHVTHHAGHMMQRVRGPDQNSSPVPMRPTQNLEQSVHSQAEWFFGGLSALGAPVYGDGLPVGAGDVMMLDTMERKRILCREIRTRLLRKQPPPPYTAPPAARLWDTEI